METTTNDSTEQEEQDEDSHVDDTTVREDDGSEGGENVDVPGTPLELRDFDIICGRDKLSQTHPGNLRFRELIETHRVRYKQCMYRNDKTCITDEILAMAQAWRPGGRFLKRDAGANGKEWRDVGDHYARQKVSHALRAHPKDTVQDDSGFLRLVRGQSGVMSYCTPRQHVSMNHELEAFKTRHRVEVDFHDLLSKQQRHLQKNFSGNKHPNTPAGVGVIDGSSRSQAPPFSTGQQFRAADSTSRNTNVMAMNMVMAQMAAKNMNGGIGNKNSGPKIPIIGMHQQQQPQWGL